MKSKIYTVLKWLLFILILLGAVLYSWSFSGMLFILAGILALPFRGLKKYFEKAFPIDGLREVVLIGVLVIALFFAPKLDFDKKDEPPQTLTVSEQLALLHSEKDTPIYDNTLSTESAYETESESETDALVTSNYFENEEVSYVFNKNSKKFHKIDCSSAKTIKEDNRENFTGTRDGAISLGYSPCGRCKP